MFSRIYVQELIEEIGLRPVGPVVEDPDVKNGFLAFIKVSQGEGGNQNPSKKQVDSALKAVEKTGALLKLAFLNDREALLNTTVNSMLEKKFPGKHGNAVVSVSGTEASVFLDTDDSTTDDDQEGMRSALIELLGYMVIDDVKVVFSRTLRLPTATTCLLSVRRYGPLSKESLVERFLQRGLDRPTETWTENTLDKLRKKGLVHRRTDKRYIMTLKGLNATGTRRDRLSPDISRALELSRTDT